MTKPIVLTLCDYYLPGYKAGGPITTLANLVTHLGNVFDFRILSRDRDLGDRLPYANISLKRWYTTERGQVRYLAPGAAGACMLRQILACSSYDVLYLNSFFSPLCSVWPLMLQQCGLLRQQPTVLAPRGELSPGALNLKRRKKRTYLRMAQALKLHRGVIWQASCSGEESDIRRHFGKWANVIVAPDLTSVPPETISPQPQTTKRPGHAKVLFLSRISPMKNLKGALSMLKHVRGSVEFTIVGPVEDHTYWRRCQEEIHTLPGNVSVSYAGPVRPADVTRVMQRHDLFFLPTLGENFGHVILEALSAGCPVLISDRTGWKGLETEGAGWDLPLDRPDQFHAILQQCVDMDSTRFERLRANALQYANRYHAQEDAAVQRNRDLFLTACSDT